MRTVQSVVAAGMALKQPRMQPLLEQVDMADDRGMMHPQRLGCRADPAQPRNLRGGADLGPQVQPHDHLSFAQ